MKPLIDGDILLYEIGYGIETGWDSPGYPYFDQAAEMLDERISNICAMVGATEEPTLYLTGKTNFRYAIATRQPYKERPSLKPYHYKNLKAYVQNVYDCVLSVGTEADDEMSLEQRRRPNDVIVCSRDKDLKTSPGWHYGWEVHNQPSFGPSLVDGVGWIKLSDPVPKKTRTLKGAGPLFFYAQCLMGDGVDTILGLQKGVGAVGAFKILDGCTTPTEAFKAVREAYRAVHGDDGHKFLLETGRLLYMTRYLDEWGNPVLWEFPDV